MLVRVPYSLFLLLVVCLSVAASIGSGSPRVMLGPAHVDVVPVTPDDASKAPDEEEYSGWDENPWSGTVKDGQLFGRGAVRKF